LGNVVVVVDEVEVVVEVKAEVAVVITVKVEVVGKVEVWDEEVGSEVVVEGIDEVEVEVCEVDGDAAEVVVVLAFSVSFSDASVVRFSSWAFWLLSGIDFELEGSTKEVLGFATIRNVVIKKTNSRELLMCVVGISFGRLFNKGVDWVEKKIFAVVDVACEWVRLFFVLESSN